MSRQDQEPKQPKGGWNDPWDDLAKVPAYPLGGKLGEQLVDTGEVIVEDKPLIWSHWKAGDITYVLVAGQRWKVRVDEKSELKENGMVDVRLVKISQLLS